MHCKFNRIMKKTIHLLLIVLLLISCDKASKNLLSEGIWRAELEVMDDEILPFNFKVIKNKAHTYQLEVYNADEIIVVDEVEISNDSIKIKLPVYEGYLSGRFTKNSIEGQFIKESLDRIVPFKATYGLEERFNTNAKAVENVSGIWEAEFEGSTPDAYRAKGIFTQIGAHVNGTFRTNTGDYRFLEGIMNGDSLKVSAFDGAHAFLFVAKVTDSSMNGAFYSGNHSKEQFVAKRNENFELASPDSLTFINEGYEKLAFSFPNENGELISLEDQRFKNKVTVVQLMGTWCPNCLDETKYYVDYLKNNASSDVAVVALAFEYAKTREKAFESITRLKERVGVEYPILLAQFGTSDKTVAQQKLPMLNHIISYPTSIFIDKKGVVRKIHTGFNGPATGVKFVEFKKDFETFVAKLLAE